MKFNKILLVAAMTSALAVSTSSCSEDYVKLNQNPSNVSKADPKGLMTQAILEFQPNDYLLWWYNVNYLTRWPQMTCPTGSFTESFTEMAETVAKVDSMYLPFVIATKSRLQSIIAAKNNIVATKQLVLS